MYNSLCVRTLLDERAKCRDSIQKLMRIIIAQGTTISTQLAGLKEKEEAIDNFEERMHNLRMRESGRDYLLHTHLDQLQEVRATSLEGFISHSDSSGSVQRHSPGGDAPHQEEAPPDQGGQGPGLPHSPPLRRSPARRGEAVDCGPGQPHPGEWGADTQGEAVVCAVCSAE